MASVIVSIATLKHHAYAVSVFLFWIKGQPYSVAHMLAHDPWTGKFTGGTIYQAFLSAQLPPLAQPGGWPDR
jgi:hypothetical protein